MNDHVSTQAWRRRWWIALFGLALFVAAVAFLVRWQNRRTANEFEAIRQAGHPVTLAEWNAWYQAIPDDQNAALKILQACSQLVSPVGWDKFPVVGNSFSGSKPLAPEHRILLQQFLTSNSNALALVHQAAGLRESRYPMDLNQGLNTLMPHLSEIKSLVQQLRNVALLHSDEGRSELALQEYTNALAVARSLSAEPTLISQLVRIACVAIAQTALEHLLSQHQLTVAQLEELAVQLHFTETNSRAGFTRGVVGERCAGLSAFQMRPYRLAQSVFPGQSSRQSFWFAMRSGLQRISGLWARDLRLYREAMGDWVESTQLAFPKVLEQSQAAEDRLKVGIQGINKYLRPISELMFSAVHKATVKEASNCARLRAAQIAVATEFYRLRNNRELPLGLSQLDPALIRGASLDPFTGKPLRYTKLDAGYVVYSVGQNGRDDAGDPKLDVTFRVDR